jgi:hypothetical protein
MSNTILNKVTRRLDKAEKLNTELLAALKGMCHAYAGTGDCSSANVCLSRYDKALATIAKAEGREA